jgi:hypothetical protein
VDLHMGTVHLSDEEFVTAFEECRIAGDSFHHADHVRLAWLYLREFGASGAQEKMLDGIRKMAAHNGALQKFHYTTTVAWLRVVAAAQKADAVPVSFEEWIVKHPALVDKKHLQTHYTKERLESEEARSGWVEPDLRPLP